MPVLPYHVSMLLFVIGPSASGKGTQANLLADKYKIPHLSVGELLRKEIEKGTELGKLIDPIIREGKFVPGHATTHVLNEAIEEAFKTNHGCIIDGFPRLYDQALQIQSLVDRHTDGFKVIHYRLSVEECIRRQKEREANGGKRTDDAMLAQRLKSYEEDIEQILEYYRDIDALIEVDASPGVEEIFEDTCRRLTDSFR